MRTREEATLRHAQKGRQVARRAMKHQKPLSQSLCIAKHLHLILSLKNLNLNYAYLKLLGCSRFWALKANCHLRKLIQIHY